MIAVMMKRVSACAYVRAVLEYSDEHSKQIRVRFTAKTMLKTGTTKIELRLGSLSCQRCRFNVCSYLVINTRIIIYVYLSLRMFSVNEHSHWISLR
jgi:uncharacterized protein (UPF0212 family)